MHFKLHEFRHRNEGIVFSATPCIHPISPVDNKQLICMDLFSYLDERNELHSASKYCLLFYLFSMDISTYKVRSRTIFPYMVRASL